MLGPWVQVPPGSQNNNWYEIPFTGFNTAVYDLNEIDRTYCMRRNHYVNGKLQGLIVSYIIGPGVIFGKVSERYMKNDALFGEIVNFPPKKIA